jgi:acetyl esterase/lipase
MVLRRRVLGCLGPRVCLLAAVASSITVYREPFYTAAVTPDVVYTKTLVNCGNQTDQSTCTEAEMVLDVWAPTNKTAGPFPIVMTVHGGAFVSGDQKMADPPNSYFAERGFVTFAVQYRLAKDKGLWPAALKGWSPKSTSPRAQWTPYIWAMYPAVRDIKAALRWVNAHAAEYNADTSSITLQGGSAGATAVIELALTGGDATFADDYTAELEGQDRTLPTANTGQPATVTGAIDYWGGLFTEDLMYFKDGRRRWTAASSVPTIAFHGTDDTTVSPESGDVLCGNLTAVGVQCLKVSLPDQKHGCWNAKVETPSGTQSIFEYAFEWMGNVSNWTVVSPGPGPGPGGNCSAAYKRCGGKDWDGPTCCQGSCKCTGTDYFKQCKPVSGNQC